MKLFVLLAALISFSACANKEKMADNMEDSKTEMTKDAQEMKANAEDSAKAEMKKAEEMAGDKMPEKKSMGESILKTACSLGSDERVINVEKTAEGGCQVLYTKFGNTKSIATAISDVSYCEGIGQKVTGNLEKAGFSCNQ